MGKLHDQGPDYRRIPGCRNGESGLRAGQCGSRKAAQLAPRSLAEDARSRAEGQQVFPDPGIYSAPLQRHGCGMHLSSGTPGLS
jgi:hypothetical protein